MEDRRFDSLVRSLAVGRNRRTVLKALLGLGGVVAGASIAETDAARRPANTPTPNPKCPGQQTVVGGVCTCPPGAPNKCGPACCTGTPGDPITATHTECCDNACCHGACYREELCCPYPREFCPVTGQCCPEGWRCCPDYGCIAPDQCCLDDDCPFRDCFAASCNAQHVCAYGDDCLNAENCCEADACFRSYCQGDGACAEAIFDCRTATGCCGDDGVCLDNGACCASPLEYCAISGECCPEGWRCCPGYGCISPGQCCDNGDCIDVICRDFDCATITCNSDHICFCAADCTIGPVEICCDAGQICLPSGECSTPN
jgi:hypothetical protein